LGFQGQRIGNLIMVEPGHVGGGLLPLLQSMAD